MSLNIKEPKIRENYVFKVPSMNLEFIEKGTHCEIRPIKVPKGDKLQKEPKF